MDWKKEKHFLLENCGHKPDPLSPAPVGVSCSVCRGHCSGTDPCLRHNRVVISHRSRVTLRYRGDRNIVARRAPDITVSGIRAAGRDGEVVDGLVVVLRWLRRHRRHGRPPTGLDCNARRRLECTRSYAIGPEYGNRIEIRSRI